MEGIWIFYGACGLLLFYLLCLLIEASAKVEDGP